MNGARLGQPIVAVFSDGWAAPVLLCSALRDVECEREELAQIDFAGGERRGTVRVRSGAGS